MLGKKLQYFILFELIPQQRRTWGHWGAQTCWEDMSPTELSFSPLPPETGALDGAPKHTQTQISDWEQQIFTNRCQSESAPWVTGRVSDQSCWSCLPEPYAPFHQWWRPSPPPLQTQTILLILINYCTYKRNSHDEMWQPDGCCGFVTLICAVVEDVEGFHRCRAPLFVTKDQINPLMEVGWHILWFL